MKKTPRRPESEVQKEIVQFFEKVGMVAWRQNSGLIKSGSRFIRVGKKGCPDIVGIWPSGQFMGCEVKSNGEPLTQAQKDFIEDINKLGGFAFVAYSLDDAISAYNDHFREL